MISSYLKNFCNIHHNHHRKTCADGGGGGLDGGVVRVETETYLTLDIYITLLYIDIFHMARHSSGLSGAYVFYNVIVGKDIVLGLNKRTTTNVSQRTIIINQTKALCSSMYKYC